MPHTPAISVVMPVYNTPVAYLKEAVESVLSQTFKDFELIVVDDGSTERETISFIDYIVDTRLVLHRLQKNQGLPNAKNIGIGIARGVYVAIMDSDDVSGPERFAAQHAFLESKPKALMCGVNSAIIGAGVSKKKYFFIDDKEIKRRIIFRNCFTAGSIMFRRAEVLEKNIQFPQFFAEDYAFNYQCTQLGEVYNLSEELFKYRVHANSMSKFFAKPEERPEVCSVYQYVLSDYLEMAVPEKYTKTQYSLIYFLDIPNFHDWLLMVRWVCVLVSHPRTSFWQKSYAVYLLFRNVLKAIKRFLEAYIPSRKKMGV
jgi:glycosyltransferase involved in cell wall biosynthesis